MIGVSKMNSKIVDKIKKLLSLATSSNEHEARLAAQKAHELIVHHNLDMQQVEASQDSDYGNLEAAEHRVMPREYKYTMIILKKYFFVEPIKERTIRGKTKIHIFGKKSNVELASYLFEFLNQSFKSCFKQYHVKGAKRANYYAGLFKGICAQLEESRLKAQSERGLVLVKDALIQTQLNKYHGRTTTSTARLSYREASAEYQDGFNDGKKLQIRKGIESSNSSDKLYLT